MTGPLMSSPLSLADHRSRPRGKLRRLRLRAVDRTVDVVSGGRDRWRLERPVLRPDGPA